MNINQEIINYVTSSVTIKNLLLSLLLFIFALIIKSVLEKKVSRNKDIKDVDLILIKRNIKNYTNLLLIIFLSLLWFTQIQSVLVSLFAVTAALVLATKEIIMSVMGGLLVRFNNHFALGDRIEVDGVRGFVIEKGLTVTKVLEVGPEKNSQQTTGDIITIPNGIMLSKTVKNESYFKNYSIKSFTLKPPIDMVFSDFEDQVMLWANEMTSNYLAEAKKLIESFCLKEGISIPAVTPRSKVIMNKGEGFELLLKIPVPNNQIGDIEQELYRRYLKLSEERSLSLKK